MGLYWIKCTGFFRAAITVTHGRPPLLYRLSWRCLLSCSAVRSNLWWCHSRLASPQGLSPFRHTETWRTAHSEVKGHCEQPACCDIKLECEAALIIRCQLLHLDPLWCFSLGDEVDVWRQFVSVGGSCHYFALSEPLSFYSKTLCRKSRLSNVYWHHRAVNDSQQSLLQEFSHSSLTLFDLGKMTGNDDVGKRQQLFTGLDPNTRWLTPAPQWTTSRLCFETLESNRCARTINMPH